MEQRVACGPGEIKRYDRGEKTICHIVASYDGLARHPEHGEIAGHHQRSQDSEQADSPPIACRGPRVRSDLAAVWGDH